MRARAVALALTLLAGAACTTSSDKAAGPQATESLANATSPDASVTVVSGEPAESFESEEPVVSGEPAESFESEEPVVSGEPAESFESEEPVVSGEPAESFESEEPAISEELADPSAEKPIAPADGFHEIDVGHWHSCGVRNDSAVECWGHNRVGQSDVPGGRFAAVTAGSWHTCGLRTDGLVRCWGYNDFGQASPPSGRFQSVIAGDEYSCGLRIDSAVECWGDNSHGQTDAPGGIFEFVVLDSWHSCGLRSDGTVACWGYNKSGQADAPDHQFRSVAVDGWHSCGLRSDDSVACWGDNDWGQADAPDGEFRAVALGSRHSCGLRSDASVVCWGDNGNGQTDAPAGQFKAVTAGDWFSCGLRTEGTVACWGHNLYGQADVPDGRFESVSAGDSYACGLRPDSSAVCWGLAVEAPSRGFSDPVQSRSQARSDCRPRGRSGYLTAGFPLPPWAVPSVDTVRVAVLFLDFPDAPALHSTHHEAELGLPYMEEYIEASSYGRLDLEFVPLHRWLRARYNHDRYSSAGGLRGEYAVGGGVDAEAVRLADPEFDFSRVDMLMVVMPGSYFYGGGSGGTAGTDEGLQSATLRVNTYPWDEPVDPLHWGSTGAHEFAHSLGLLDMYSYYGRAQRPDPPAGRAWIQAKFGLMGLEAHFLAPPEDLRLSHVWHFPDGYSETTYVSSVEAAEMLAWSRWQLGWLDISQVHCITESEATVSLSPVSDPGDGIAMAVVPLSETEVIVVESRRKIGRDAERTSNFPDGIYATYPALVHDGVVVYTVDAGLYSGDLPVEVAGGRGNGQFDDYPVLVEGQSVAVRGYTISVLATDAATHTITISKTDG